MDDIYVSDDELHVPFLPQDVQSTTEHQKTPPPKLDKSSKRAGKQAVCGVRKDLFGKCKPTARGKKDSHSPADISLCFREYISSSRHGGATLDQPYVAPLWSSLHVSAPATRSRWLTMSSRFMARRVPLAPLTTVCEHLHSVCTFRR
nr:uncharacterized protein LOC120976374 isoform X4 [Aegilops tauschii subsp. strangulata]XP_045089987.1 uncharacterized protein LOC120976374 isoform X4 [Aegilops tauschii subsp. strangulata]XP_045089988.1 uncharacterized protein LOC120976374 isoform X4 [Aegilops tauschii subsp. strangulata]XP_045089989.1 uncharacterized protein LOC120976374 isoform X4 [Aegilops tauschii subsp. strangulata]